MGGVDMLLRPARDRKGALVGSKAVGKYGTPKCEFITQLVLVSEPENRHINARGVWVGAHPSLGEKLTHEMLKRGLVKELGELVEIKREVRKICGTNMRVDFVVTHKDGTRTAVEVKTVVDTDYDPAIGAGQRGGVPVVRETSACGTWSRGQGHGISH